MHIIVVNKIILLNIYSNVSNFDMFDKTKNTINQKKKKKFKLRMSVHIVLMSINSFSLYYFLDTHRSRRITMIYGDTPEA